MPAQSTNTVTEITFTLTNVGYLKATYSCTAALCEAQGLVGHDFELYVR